MKKFLLFIITLFVCVICRADTFTQYWYADGNSYATTSCTTGGDIILPTPPTKYGYDFIGWEKLPITRIEYLENSGTQYIDAGIRANQDTRIIVKQKTLINDVVIGARYSFNSQAFCISSNFNGSPSFFINYNNTYTDGGSNSGTTVLDLNKNKFYRDGTLKYSFNYAYFATPGNIWIFGCNGMAIGNGQTQVYYVKIYDNDVLIRDFIPVLDQNDTPCMYDLLEGKFYYNQGTGDFIAGPQI